MDREMRLLEGTRAGLKVSRTDLHALRRQAVAGVSFERHSSYFGCKMDDSQCMTLPIYDTRRGCKRFSQEEGLVSLTISGQALLLNTRSRRNHPRNCYQHQVILTCHSGPPTQRNARLPTSPPLRGLFISRKILDRCGD